MRIAFYAPLKPPDHPRPSGDRAIARLLIAAWRRLGVEVEIASRMRARVKDEDKAAMAKIAARGGAIAERLIRKFRRRKAKDRPQAWFTYHLYYKAPDWIGPIVAEALDIPYLVAEASHAGKRAGGPFDLNHRAVTSAIRKADAIFCLNPADRPGLLKIAAKRRLIDLSPFLDVAKFDRRLPDRETARAALARQYGLSEDRPWLLAVGMMRRGDKLASYRVLAAAMAHHRDPFHLILVGDGPAREEIAAAFRPFARHVAWAGQQPSRNLPWFYRAADFLVWPAINEAFGMALLEAQAAGLPIVAGASGGVPSILIEGKTGFLARPGDPGAFVSALGKALGADRAKLRKAAAAHIAARHDIEGASAILKATLDNLGLS